MTQPMMQRDLGLDDIPVVRNCPERWDPPSPGRTSSGDSWASRPRPRSCSTRASSSATGASKRRWTPSWRHPRCGPGAHGHGRPTATASLAALPRYADRVHVIDPVPPVELLVGRHRRRSWSWPSSRAPRTTATSRPRSCWEAMAAGVPVGRLATCRAWRRSGPRDRLRRAVRPAVPDVDRGRHPAHPRGGPEGIRQLGDRVSPRPHDRYDWASQFGVLDVGLRPAPGPPRGSDPVSDPCVRRPATPPATHARPPARIAILSHGTSAFDSRAQRIARTCAAAGDTGRPSTPGSWPGSRSRSSWTAIASCAFRSTIPTHAWWRRPRQAGHAETRSGSTGRDRGLGQRRSHGWGAT